MLAPTGQDNLFLFCLERYYKYKQITVSLDKGSTSSVEVTINPQPNMHSSDFKAKNKTHILVL